METVGGSQTDDRTSSTHNVSVFVRCRPLSDLELSVTSREVVQETHDRRVVQLFNHERTKDRLFPSTATNTEVYGIVGQEIVLGARDGYNCTVFVYGATGTGKTHTIIGPKIMRECHEQQGFSIRSAPEYGLVQLIADDLFAALRESTKSGKVYQVFASFCQIYKEKVNDLLGDETKGDLRVKEDANGNFFVQDAAEMEIHSSEELELLVRRGEKRRVVRATKDSLMSSRSHALLIITVENIGVEKSDSLSTAGRIMMVDLAGSERFDFDETREDSSIRHSERKNINTSLLSLGNVIEQLANADAHIQYRNSVLTMLLKNSLGGNSRTYMFACISPSILCVSDTYNTLHYASRAKQIRCIMTQNVVDGSRSNESYEKQLKSMETKIDLLERTLSKNHIQIPREAIDGNIQKSINETSRSQSDIDAIFDVSDLTVEFSTALEEGNLLTAILQNTSGSKVQLGGRTSWILLDEEGNVTDMLTECQNTWIIFLKNCYVGKYVKFQFFPIGFSRGKSFALSKLAGPIVACSPTIKNLQIVGKCEEGDTLFVNFDYFGGDEGVTRIAWRRMRPSSSVKLDNPVFHTSRALLLTGEDVGFSLQCTVIPERKDGVHSKSDITVSSDVIVCGQPRISRLALRFKRGRIVVSGQYSGGREGKSRVLWEKSGDAVNFFGIVRKDGKPRIYTPSANDLGFFLRVRYCPIRDDGLVGDEMVSNSVRLRISDSLWSKVNQVIVGGQCSFNVSVVHESMSMFTGTLLLLLSHWNLQFEDKNDTSGGRISRNHDYAPDLQVLCVADRKDMLRVIRPSTGTDLTLLVDNVGQRDFLVILFRTNNALCIGGRGDSACMFEILPSELRQLSDTKTVD